MSLPFLEHMGARLVDLGEGRARVGLDIEAWHLQHLGFVHGGVISTLSDNTGWYAAMSKLPAGRTSVTTEIKINYLKPAQGRYLEARARVLRRGKTLAFVVVEVYCDEQMIAYATGSYAILEAARFSR
ncbi:MAG: PaaI family thioesterase [Pseudomonadota bacterium]|uniref:PaaI family thioesterase n=1 Tax=Thermithiobacillus tepidarius TaxID=929 RepID=UPI001B7FA205|nr:PaaI family thioesterase [Thermithiobacillus tepidarius]